MSPLPARVSMSSSHVSPSVVLLHQINDTAARNSVLLTLSEHLPSLIPRQLVDSCFAEAPSSSFAKWPPKMYQHSFHPELSCKLMYPGIVYGIRPQSCTPQVGPATLKRDDARGTSKSSTSTTAGGLGQVLLTVEHCGCRARQPGEWAKGTKAS